jgi:multiple sugar transport system substrate-binding protein
MSLLRTALLLVALGGTALAAEPPQAGAPAESPHAIQVSFARFFGSCEADYGRSTEPATASGECGIITALVNRFNLLQRGRIEVRTQVIEHNAYYSQLGARIVAGDVPAVVMMHSSVLNDFVQRSLVAPLDDEFARAGIAVADFTPQAGRAVAVAGHHYALPFDTHSWLWHVNLNLMRQAGLVTRQGKPLVPRNPEELLEQARQFKARTGKPYFVWLTANDPVFFARTLLTLVSQQGESLFPHDDAHIDLHGAAVRRAVALMKTLYDEGLTSRGHDYGAALQAFEAGQGGVMVNGTWLIGDLHRQAGQPGAALYRGYTALPFPRLYAQPAAWADNHVMVMLKGGTGDARVRAAALEFMRFIYEEGGVWARTGQLPTRQSVVASQAFRSLPLRGEIADIATIGTAMPLQVARQSMVFRTLGENLGAIVAYGAPAGQVLPRTETSINRMLVRAGQFRGP